MTTDQPYVPTEQAADQPDPGSAPLGIRARNRAALEEEILEAGRRHLARDGAAALSLLAIARDLGMVSSALYRYVANRDDLLTLLIVAAYTSLGDAVEQAARRHTGGRPRCALGRHRARPAQWALAHPARVRPGRTARRSRTTARRRSAPPSPGPGSRCPSFVCSPTPARGTTVDAAALTRRGRQGDRRRIWPNARSERWCGATSSRAVASMPPP